MTILFTEKEKKYLIISEKAESDYRLTYRKDTPPETAQSIQRKIDSHKQWLTKA